MKSSDYVGILAIISVLVNSAWCQGVKVEIAPGMILNESSAGDINKDETVNFLDVCIIAEKWCNEE